MSLRAVLARPVPAAAATAVVLAPVIVALVLISTTSAAPQPIDYGIFGPGGAALLTGRWSRIFADPILQAGPFELLPFGILHLLGVSGSIGWTVALTACGMLTAFVTALVLRPTLAPDLRSSLLSGVGTLVLAAAGPGTSSWAIGHPSEVLVPLVWVVAGRLALRDRPALAAVLVALSSGFEVWGVLGAPVVLLAPRIRFVRSAAAGAAALVVLWAPFVLAGPFRMFAFAWPVMDPSLLHALDPTATAFPWSLRLLQAVAAVGAGAAVALLLRGRDAAWGPWAVGVAVVAARLVLDPVLAGYYWFPALVCGVGAVVLAARRADLVGAAAGAAVVLLTGDLGQPVLRAVVLVLVVVGLAALARRRRPRPFAAIALRPSRPAAVRSS